MDTLTNPSPAQLPGKYPQTYHQYPSQNVGFGAQQQAVLPNRDQLVASLAREKKRIAIHCQGQYGLMQRDALEKHSTIMLGYLTQQQDLNRKIKEVTSRIDSLQQAHSCLGLQVTVDEWNGWKLEKDILAQRMKWLNEMISREEMHQRAVMYAHHQLINLHTAKSKN